jgi:hypothetical protein
MAEVKKQLNRHLILKAAAWILGVISLLAALNAIVSKVSVRHQCRKSCWINELLYALFDEEGGRLALACIWLCAGLIFFLLGSRGARPSNRR